MANTTPTTANRHYGKPVVTNELSFDVSVLANSFDAIDSDIGGLLAAVAAKINAANAALTGVPTAPTAAAGTNTAQIATTQYVRSEISSMVGAAPSQLDTLAEFATALGNDANFSATITASLGNRLRVDVNNQGLTPTQQGNARTNLGLGGAALLDVGQAAGTVAAGNDSRWLAGAFTTCTVAGSAVWHAGNFNPAAYLPLSGATMTGTLTGATLSMSMSQDGGAARGSFTCRASGSGDANMAGLSFWNDGYAIKLGVRSDGYFALGGWSRAVWSWYSDSSGNMVAAGNINAYSDPRLKDDVVRITDALAIIRQLDGVRFTWNTTTTLIGRPGTRDIGVLADQIEAVLPELIGYSIADEANGGERWKMVAYDKIAPVLIEGIKAQQDIIETQQTQLDALTAWARANGFQG